jgi:hypothetical protein
VAALESELHAANKHADELLQAEKKRNDRDMDRLRSEWTSQRAAADDRISRLQNDLAGAKVCVHRPCLFYYDKTAPFL